MRYLLVDGSHLAYRCRFAQVANLCTAAGRRSGVVYGFLRGLDFAKRKTGISARNIFVFWDGGRAAGRMAIHPGYKLKPDASTPEEEFEKKVFWEQVAAVKDGLALREVRNITIGGTEADDLIAIHTFTLREQGHEVVIFTGDKDLQQLASPRVSIFHPEKELLDEAAILEKWGVPNVSDIVRLRAIIGDPSDKIDGVPTVGEKRALLVLPHWDLIFDTRPLTDLGPSEKWVAKCREHVSVIRRNLQLSILPHHWAESFYGIEAAIEMTSQTDDSKIVNDLVKFISFCNEWEIQNLDMQAW